MGPRSRSNPTAARSLAVVDRLRRRLRSKGLRASYNLQMVRGQGRGQQGPRGEGHTVGAAAWLAVCGAVLCGRVVWQQTREELGCPSAQLASRHLWDWTDTSALLLLPLLYPTQVPREQDYLAVLHITPLRASRPLALRYLAQRLGRPLDHWVVLGLSPETSGSADDDDLVAGSYCSDTSDLLGGLQKVGGLVVVVGRTAGGGSF